MNDLISIVMPTYNVENYVIDAIESIINQTFTNWELIITDDCSTDNTRDIIRKYVDKDKRIKLFCLDENSGAGVARNNSINKANGRYIAFCDSDDWWYPDKLYTQYKFMTENSYEFVFSVCEFCNENLEIRGISKKKRKISYLNLCIGNNVGTPGVIYDTKRISKVYMPIMRKRQDWAMWINLIRETKYAYSTKTPLWKCRKANNTLSSNKFDLLKYNYAFYHDFLRFSILKAFLIMLFVFFPNHLFRKFKVMIDSFFYTIQIKSDI